VERFKIDPLLPYISCRTSNTYPMSESLKLRMEKMPSINEDLEDEERISKETFEYLRMILSGLEQQDSSLPDACGHDKEGGIELLFKDIICTLDRDGYFSVISFREDVGVPRFQMPQDCNRIVQYLKNFYSLQKQSKISIFQKGEYVKTMRNLLIFRWKKFVDMIELILGNFNFFIP
jgi:hypothetical protein